MKLQECKTRPKETPHIRPSVINSNCRDPTRLLISSPEKPNSLPSITVKRNPNRLFDAEAKGPDLTFVVLLHFLVV